MIRDIIQRLSKSSIKRKSPQLNEKERTDILEYRVWNELVDAKKNDNYLAGYLSSIRTKKKRINMAVIICAFIGLILEKWIDDASFYTLILFVLIQLLKEIFPILSVDEKLLDKLPEYRMLYVQKFELLNKLYFDMQCEAVDADTAQSEYFKIREMNLRIEDLDNSIHLPVKRKVFAKAESETRIYLNNFFHIDYNLENC